MLGYVGCQPSPCLSSRVYCRSIDPELAREWGLARCGHHPCSDGRPCRHMALSSSCNLCGGLDGSLRHLLASCSGVLDLRQRWLSRVHLAHLSTEVAAGILLHPWIFTPGHAWNSASSVCAHVCFVGAACRRVRAAGAGCVSGLN